MSVKKFPSGTVADCANPEDEESLPPPPESHDGDIATPKSQALTEDDQPLD